MIINRKFNPRFIKKNRLLSVYIPLIIDHNPNTEFSKEDLKELLKKEFNYEASLESIENYFEPNFYERRLDLELQMKNLHIRYD